MAVGFGTILRSTDGGTTWKQQLSDDLTTYYGVAFTDRNIGYVVGSNGTFCGRPIAAQIGRRS